jgi:hypothetical protein
MNMMFLNSLERRLGTNQAQSAQVWIAENEGQWLVSWQETEEGEETAQETWYEGSSMEQMLTAFRLNIFTKQGEGFKPLLDVAVPSEPLSLDKRSIQIRLLHYYSELNVNTELYEELRQWRLQQSNKEGKAPFLVATNRLLQMVSAFLPQSEDELQQLPGMGANKASVYGAELLELTRQRERTTSFPLLWVQSEVDTAKFHVWLQLQKDRKMKAEQIKRDTKRQLLEAITRGDSLDALPEQLKLQRRELLLWMEELDREGYDLEPYVEQMLRNVPVEEQNMAWSAFESQGDRYLKPVLQALYKKDELEGKDIDRIYEWLRLLRMKFRRTHTLRQAEAG